MTVSEHSRSYEDQASVSDSFSLLEKAWISPRSRSKKAGGKNRLMKAVRSSSHVSIVPSLKFHYNYFLLPSTGMRFSLTMIKWLPLIANSLAVSRIVIAEPGVRATTRSAAHMGSSSIGKRFSIVSESDGSGDVENCAVHLLDFNSSDFGKSAANKDIGAPVLEAS
ncbi:hypothetical protein Tco_0079899 [Tanacetum coccineum]